MQSRILGVPVKDAVVNLDRQRRFQGATGGPMSMTTVAVLVDPSADRTPLAELVEAGVLTESEARDLYGAMARDVCGAVEDSGGELLVNYAPAEDGSDAADEGDAAAEGGNDPAGDADHDAAERAARELVADGLSDPSKTRFEVQVGSTHAARVGNTVTHLLEREGVQSAAVVEPAAAMMERRHVDSAAMKLRGSEAVLGPSPGGRVWYAAFTEPIDFTDAFERPAIGTLTDRASDEGYDVDYIERLPLIESEVDLASFVAETRARRRAERWVPPHTAAAIEGLGLGLESDGRDLRVVRD